MYGKIHGSFFDSSINDTDPVTRFIFVAMIVFSDQHGRLDITPSALARRINVDRTDIDRAIDILSLPDPMSRSANHDGRRIIPIDAARSWGWIIVNKEQYRSGECDPEHVRAQTRERVRRHRSREKNQKKTTKTDTYTDTGVTDSNAGNAEVTETTLRRWFESAWDEYPRKAGKKSAWTHYQATVRSVEDRDGLLRHLANYKAQLAADKTEFRYTMKGSTWFNNWTDEEYASPPTVTRSFPALVPLGGQR